MASFHSYLKGIKAEIAEISVSELKQLSTDPALPELIDIREQSEYVQGSIAGAQWISRGFLELKIEAAVPNRDAQVVLYCAGGIRSALAARSLAELGYTNVKSLAGGFGAWKRAWIPI